MQNPQQVVVVQSTKNPGLAALLGCLFGPLGLLYSTVTGALVMFCVNAVTALLTFGFGLLLTWPLCGLWGYLAASGYNKKLLAKHGTTLSLLLLSAFLYSGCVSIGHKVDQDKVSQIQKGVTTKEQVHDWLGAPEEVTTDNDGNTTWTYQYNHYSAQAQNFIPYIGGLVGGSNAENQRIVVTFNRDSIVSKVSSSYGGTEANSNLTAGPKGDTPQ